MNRFTFHRAPLARQALVILGVIFLSLIASPVFGQTVEEKPQQDQQQPPPGSGLPGRPTPPGNRAEELAITGVEIIVERMDGQRFIRVFSVKD